MLRLPQNLSSTTRIGVALALFTVSTCGFLGAAPPEENRVAFNVFHNGEAIAGAEVCLFHGVFSNSPLVEFGQDDEVTCFASSSVLDIPSGLWNAYTHVSDSLISAQPDVLIYEGKAEAYHEVDVSVVKAASLDMSALSVLLGKDDHLGVWIANTSLPAMPSVIRPLPRGEERVLVPDGEFVVPLILNHGRLVSIGDLLRADARKPTRVNPWSRRGNTLVTWIKTDWDQYKAATDKGGLSVAHAEYVAADGTSYQPTFLRSGPSYELDLVVFRNLPTGNGRIVLSGESWAESTLDVSVPREGLIVTEAPLIASPAATLEIHWPFNPPEICRGEPATVLLRHCAAGACIEVARDKLRASGTVFRNVKAGQYEAEIRGSLRPPITWNLEVTPGKHSVDIPVDTVSTVRGRVTRGGASIHADVEFATGSGGSDQDGNYLAITATPPGRDSVRVVICETGQEYFDDPEHAVGSVYDIAIPETTVHAIVHSRTGTALSGSSVDLNQYYDEAGVRVRYSMVGPPADAEGRSSIVGVQPGRHFNVCAQHEGFTKACSSILHLEGARDEATVEIVLNPDKGTPGRVITGAEVLSGALWWVSPSTGVTESVAVAKNGTFRSQQRHDMSEYAILSSANLPLCLLTSSTGPSGELQLQPIGSATRIEVSVTSAPGATRYLAVMIDGHMIPEEALDQHTSFRGISAMILNGQPVTIPDILSTAQITVILGPSPQAMPPLSTARDWKFEPTIRSMYETRTAKPPVARFDF